MAKRLAKKQRATREARNKRTAPKAKTGKQNDSADKIIDDFSQRFSQITEQYEVAEPDTRRRLRKLHVYGGLYDAIAEATLEQAKESMTYQEIASICDELTAAVHAWGAAVILRWKRMGSRPPNPEFTKAESRQAAEIAGINVKANAGLISLSALQGDKWFFIYLGKYLSDEIASTFPDKLDFSLWEILRHTPSITAKDAVRELQKRGWPISRKDADAESAFRMRKKRAGFSKFMRVSRDSQSHKS